MKKKEFKKIIKFVVIVEYSSKSVNEFGSLRVDSIRADVIVYADSVAVASCYVQRLLPQFEIVEVRKCSSLPF